MLLEARLLYFLRFTNIGNAVVGAAALVAVKYALDLVARINRWILVGNRVAARQVLGDRRVGLTVNSVVISLIRYLVYFVLLGWTLERLHVPLATYLASVSFVAIAIGFGVQGLVQDIVTGFFLIFERQIDVGDMVLVNGQTGIVCDFGLRITQVRLFDGGRAFIPNRTIMQIVNYRARGLEAAVDVRLPADKRQQAGVVLAATAADIARQFPHAVRGGAPPPSWTDLSGGSGFLRARLPVWPGQLWVVDGQWVPRLKAGLAAAGIPPEAVDVSSHYGADEPPARPPRRLAP